LLQNKLDSLINAALRAGGKDNVTAVLCELEMYSAAADEKGASYSNARANGK
jgi:serine/threonine protein phosphatase PrpC